jgi:hypothetical protein
MSSAWVPIDPVDPRMRRRRATGLGVLVVALARKSRDAGAGWRGHRPEGIPPGISRVEDAVRR